MPPTNWVSTYGPPSRRSNRVNELKVWHWIMMTTASPRIQSRNGNRFTENPGRRFPSGGLDYIRQGSRMRDRFPVFPHSLQVQSHRLPHPALSKFQRSARCDTPRKVRNVSAVPGLGLGVNRGVLGVFHVHYFRPACLRMLFNVPGSTSSLRWPAMVTRPGFLGCLYWRWLLPVPGSIAQPAFSLRVMMSRTFMISPPVVPRRGGCRT